jgi:glucosylceramidase
LNLAIDENGNPATAKKGRSGVITINSQTGEITRNLEYYALRSITQNKTGARRVLAHHTILSGVLIEIGSAAFMITNGDVTVIITIRCQD